MLETVPRRKTRDVVADRLKPYITDRRFKPGDRLPATTALAEMFGVSRLTLREATKTLEFFGLISLSGAGVRAGCVHGMTDEHGIRAADKPVHVHDFHATILHLIALDHTRLTYRHAGRGYRLTDVHGNVVHEILS